MTERLSYEEFLRAKVNFEHSMGLPCEASEVNPLLFPHQRDIVLWGVRGGRRAIFAAFGLGKSFMQLEIARLIEAKAEKRFLIVMPLGVRQEFKRDAAKLKIPVQFVRRIEECGPRGIYLTNYETVRDGKLDPREFAGVSLDEAAVLRGFGGTKTFREMMRLFEGTALYRFVATACPSPNEYIELLSYAAFLDVMDVGQAKTRFFKRDSTKADTLTLHPHKSKEFWLWVSTWAIFLQKPSDLGHSDEGYVLPKLEVHWHEIPSDHSGAGVERNGQGKLLRNAAIGVQDAAREKKSSLGPRIQKVVELVQGLGQEESVFQGLLPAEQAGISGTPETSPAGVLPSLLSGEQGKVQEVLPGSLSEAQGKNNRTQSEVAIGEPGAIQRIDPPLRREESRQGERSKRGMVSTEQGQGERNESEEQVAALRSDPSNFRRNVEAAETSMRYLPCALGSAEDRPLSRDAKGSRPSVQGLQLGTGDVSRQSEVAASRTKVSGQFIIWCDRNDEQDAIEVVLEKLGVSFSSLRGSDSIEDREERLEAWRRRETSAFVTKPVMYGAGVNLQQCHVAIFCGVGYKFSEFVQGIARLHRFLQTSAVQIHIIYTEAEREIRRTLEKKWTQHVELTEKMAEIIREYGLASADAIHELRRSIGCERTEVKGDNFTLVNNDAVLETQQMAENSVHLILSSIPFSTQYEYTPSYNDFGHTDSNPHFFEQMDYLTPELLRVLKPGRVAAIHVKDRIVPGGMTGLGFQTVYPFHSKAIDHFIKHGFAFLGMKTIVTDVVRENNQTYRLGWTEQCKDGSRMGFGMPEYLLLFRKPPTDSSNGYADEPVVKDKEKYSRSRWQIDAHGFTRSNGNRLLSSEELDGLDYPAMFKRYREHSLSTVYDFEHHVELCEHLETCQNCGHIHTGEKRCDLCDCKVMKSRLPTTFMLLQPQSLHPDVWTDITRMLTLNGAQSAHGREMHLCPMQFDLADRVIAQFTMEGETVFDPFVGIGSVVYRALKLKRKGVGVELSAKYFVDAVAYCKAAEQEAAVPSLFEAYIEVEA